MDRVIRKRQQVAATLVEILTVLAIIIVLAGISFPVYAHVTTTARHSATLSALHQNYLAIQLYQEREGSQLLPYALSDTSIYTIRTRNELWGSKFELDREPPRLADLLYPFLKDRRVLRSHRAPVVPPLAEMFGKDYFGWNYDEQRAILGVGPRYSPETAVWMNEYVDYDDPMNGNGRIGCLYESGSTKMVPRQECLSGVRDLAMEQYELGGSS